jgi:hypothetical protein
LGMVSHHPSSRNLSDKYPVDSYSIQTVSLPNTMRVRRKL